MAIVRVDRGAIVLTARNLPWRLFLTVFILAIAVPPVYRGYLIFRADRIVRWNQTFDGYSRALGYDPSNATLWWHRGRLRHYSVDVVDLPQAISDYRKALFLNPRLSQAWVDLADCYERSERYDEAEAALNNAFATHTYSPVTRWQAGNFFLRRGNLAQMYECFKMACEYDPEKLGIAIETAWKVDSEHAAILHNLVPDNLPANLSYLSFLVSLDQLDLARPAWERALKCEVPPDSTFNVASSFAYIDHLLVKNRVDEAGQIWNEAIRKSGIVLGDAETGTGSRARSSLPPNLVCNGSFENEILRGGLDWRYPDIPEVQFQVELNNRMEGLKSFKVTFEGSNISFAHLSQIVPIPHPGTYVLDFYLRSEGLSTDQRPYMSIQGYPGPDGATLRTESFPESTGWKKISSPFVVKDNCRAILLGLRRDPSSKFDNRIKGSLWLDGFSIHASPEPAAVAAGGRGTAVGN